MATEDTYKGPRIRAEETPTLVSPQVAFAQVQETRPSALAELVRGVGAVIGRGGGGDDDSGGKYTASLIRQFQDDVEAMQESGDPLDPNKLSVLRSRYKTKLEVHMLENEYKGTDLTKNRKAFESATSSGQYFVEQTPGTITTAVYPDGTAKTFGTFGEKEQVERVQEAYGRLPQKLLEKSNKLPPEDREGFLKPHLDRVIDKMVYEATAKANLSMRETAGKLRELDEQDRMEEYEDQFNNDVSFYARKLKQQALLYQQMVENNEMTEDEAKAAIQSDILDIKNDPDILERMGLMGYDPDSLSNKIGNLEGPLKLIAGSGDPLGTKKSGLNLKQKKTVYETMVADLKAGMTPAQVNNLLLLDNLSDAIEFASLRRMMSGLGDSFPSSTELRFTAQALEENSKIIELDSLVTKSKVAETSADKNELVKSAYGIVARMIKNYTDPDSEDFTHTTNPKGVLGAADKLYNMPNYDKIPEDRRAALEKRVDKLRSLSED